MNIQDAYNEWSDIYDSNINRTRDLDAEVTRLLLKGQRFPSILEIGCGTGKNTEFLATLGDVVLAFDFSENMLAKARQKVTASHVRFEQADITQPWNCPPDSFELITCNLVLEHIQDLNHIFAQAARTLRGGGQFLINELHPFKQYGGTKARFERGADIVEVDVFIHHISEFIHAAEANGLKLIKFDEVWHADDAGKPPRLASFMFEKD
ncbi:MAG TPA: class I SAM-dependent methyltransferase [Anaerolineales bacterium]|nr:class I SAM-dependent methyltransferase [Anaerolineales bacterium]HNB35733.1 class I SAM-dependent methyltransferase [Anaerolineales bacterium]